MQLSTFGGPSKSVKSVGGSVEINMKSDFLNKLHGLQIFLLQIAQFVFDFENYSKNTNNAVAKSSKPNEIANNKGAVSYYVLRLCIGDLLFTPLINVRITGLADDDAYSNYF